MTGVTKFWTVPAYYPYSSTVYMLTTVVAIIAAAFRIWHSLGMFHLATELLRHGPDNLAGWRVPRGIKVHGQRVDAIPYTAGHSAPYCRP